MTWTELLNQVRALLNDTDGAVYTDTVLLPYLNIARGELQELFELNNIPVTNTTSDVINVPAGTSAIGFDTPLPAVLPSDLVEIQQLWESQEDQNEWMPMTKREYLTAALLGNTELTIFQLWSWQQQQIRVRACIVDLDIKIDYICSLFSPLNIGDLSDQINILNIDSTLKFRTAALACEFIDEDETRATANNTYAVQALERSLGISIKGKQSIAVRRLPFRARFKAQRTML